MNEKSLSAIHACDAQSETNDNTKFLHQLTGNVMSATHVARPHALN